MSDQQLISNRYQLGELLNEGGMGLVYHGTDTYSGQPVAIKLLKPEMVAGQPDLVKRFSREAEVLRALNHPNIVEVMATVTGEDDQYIVMEYVGGGSLRELLDQEKQLAISRVLEITLDLTDALTRAHRLYIIHRDLKPANVLLESDGTPRLSDFGLAKVGTSNIIGPSGLTQAGTILGTIDYMSPEACRGEEADARADIWALGVMLFEMLTGTRPFSDPSTAGILSAILTQPVPDLEALRPETPTDLADLIYRMLEKDREERVPSVRLVGAELEVILLGTTDSSDRTSRPVPPAMRFVTSTPHPFGVPRHNLPLQTTPFVGRKVELSDLASLISEPDNRLITLLGPGGAGKTRLALEAAKAQLSNFSDGVYFVSMASLTSAENIVPAIAEAVGYQFFEHMEPREQLVGFFSEKKILLVLDNFEHLLDGVGLVSEILRSAPFVKVLATSRQSLNLQQEVHFRIVGMDVPEETLPISLEKAGQYSAISLFLQSARRVSPNFELKTEDLEAVIRICHLVTGSPLGILLASAWTEMFSPQEIAEEISGNLDFLETEVSDISGRHRSIRAVFESSWNQLSEEERKTFRRLSIFRGGFKRQAAQAVCGARLPMLITLVRKSLLHRDPASGRYEIHELLRQYAKEQLDSSGEADSARAAHIAYYAAFMEKRLAAMLGPRQVKALDEIEAEFSNVSQAWRWAVANKAYEAIDQASESLFVYSDMRSREHEGIALLGMARERLTPLLDEEPDPAWERLLLPWYDLVLQSKGRPENTQEIERLAGNSLAAAQKRDDQLGMAYGLILLGHFTEPAKALKMYEQALTLCPRLDDSFWVRIRIGFCHRSLGEHHQELKAFQQSYERGRELGESEKMGWSLFNKSRTEINIGDHVNALAHLREAKTHFHQVSTLLGIIWTNIDLSFLMLLKGDIEEIRSLVEETQEIARDANRSDAIKKETLILLGYIALIEQDYQNAQHTFEETLALHTASPEVSLGMTFVAWELEDYSTAGHYLLDAIRPASPYRIPEMIMLCLPAAALALSDQDEATWAVKLLALASHHPKGPKDLFERWPLLIRLQNELTAAISPQEFDTAWKQGQALNLTETLTKLANHLQIEDDPHKALEKQEPSLPASVRFYLVEPLSEREMEILQLLKTELSGPEIANELTVSLNTVRFHTKNIYSKLQVSSRRSAVHRAIELGL